MTSTIFRKRAIGPDNERSRARGLDPPLVGPVNDRPDQHTAACQDGVRKDTAQWRNLGQPTDLRLLI